eukprot:TRINITY_DN24282_c0_g1_i1.p1 TRINITY_DN24282_c0_g1~~TRINITY_DN24282_c0_g1_i1.p1  ORF type:complete len:123 (+),score=27.44 TRINITY_DN24282_c0_g1_i1:41-409(+)
MADEPKYLYHYTTKKAKDEIAKQGHIRPSRNTWVDTRHGVGVYFTSRPPHCNDDTLLWNNYETVDGPCVKKVESYIRVPFDMVRGAVTKCPYDTRDVYVIQTTVNFALPSGTVCGDRAKFEN